MQWASENAWEWTGPMKTDDPDFSTFSKLDTFFRFPYFGIIF